jgi:predicted dehydrogenase
MECDKIRYRYLLLVPAFTFRGQVHKSAEREITVGIVGSGYMAREYCKVIRNHPAFRLVGITSRTEENSQILSKEFGLTFSPKSVSELSEIAKPDLIVVAVSESATAEVVKNLMDSSAVLLVEKPFGLSVQEARQLNDWTNNRKEPTYVAFNRRFYDSTMKLVSGLNQSVGNRFILLQDQHDTLAATRNGFDKITVDNWMFANAIHTVDLIRHLARGEAHVERISRTPLGDNSFVLDASLGFTAGDQARYVSIWNAPGPWVLNVYTETNRWLLAPLEELDLQTGESRKTSPLVRPSNQDELKPGLWNIFEELQKHWAGQEPAIPTPESSLESMELVSKIYQTSG